MPPRPAAPPALPRHPIQIVAARTGLSADVIRAWEKRYAVVAPARSEAGRRLYSDADVDRLKLLARATISGRTIKQVAALAPDTLAALVRADAATVAEGEVAGPALVPETVRARHAAAGEPLAVCLDAIARFDVVALDAALRRAAVALSAVAFLDTLVVPLWNQVLERVHGGSLRVAHEHLALSSLRRALDRVIDAASASHAPPNVVIATPLGQSQELGALVVAATAATEGWRPLYLGPGLPAEAIADTATQIGAEAVTLSLGTAPGDRVVSRELRRLRALLPGVPILVEGAGADAHRGVLREIDAVVLRDPAALRDKLRARLGTRLRALRDS